MIQEDVYKIVRLIPKGRATSYGAIAKAVGAARSARLVGTIVGKSYDQVIPVPAHRVVNRNGLLTGKHHFGSANEMADLLAGEGVKVENDKIINFKEVFWDPMTELSFE